MATDLLVLFGATGDLATKKILPALNKWYDYEIPYSKILCLGRKNFTTDKYIEFIETKGSSVLNENIKNYIEYICLEFKDSEGYIKLNDIISSYNYSTKSFYLAVKPQLFKTISENIFNTRIFEKGNDDYKIIFEKPFGEDLESFKAIQNEILNFLDESQIYRIDHYLGKDMIRNILILRFGNQLFENCWNKNSIEEVKITAFESDGVNERIDYYNSSGAINDMIQSHLLQIMSLVTMDKPENFDSDNIRLKKSEAMRKFDLNRMKKTKVGQYKEYRDINDNLKFSNTETYVKTNLVVRSEFWEGVNFVIETGKKMKEKKTQIEISFKTSLLFLDSKNMITPKANKLIIKVYPREGVNFKFNSKAPGYGFDIDTVESEYCHECRSVGNKPEAYVKLFMDVKNRDKTLFVSFEEIKSQWIIAEKIKKHINYDELFFYEEGEL